MAQTVRINGVTYNDVKAFEVPLASDSSKVVTYPDTSDGNLDAAKMPKGMKGYSQGKVVTGTANENGDVAETLDADNSVYNVPSGFSDGGTVQIVPETVNITPSKEAQTIKPAAGKVITQANVGKIPDKYQDVSGVTAEESDVVKGKKIVLPDGSLKEGTHTDPVFTLTEGVLTIK